MKPRTKETLKDGFGCLVNNAAAMRGAKNGPLWLTIVMFFLSVLLPVLPLFISAANTNGSAFISNNTYGLETYITYMADEMKADGYELVLDQKDHLMTVVSDDPTKFDYNDYITYDPEDPDKVLSAEPFWAYEDAATGEYDFFLYVSDLNGDSKAARSLNNYVGVRDYKVGTIEKRSESDAEDQKYYYASYAIVFKDTIYVVINYGTKAVAASLGGYFTGIKVDDANGLKCLEALLTVKDKDGNAITPSMANPDYYNGVLNNFKRGLNNVYDAVKWKNTFVTSGIYLAIFAGLSIFMGLLMWVMTRGKRNPNNYFSIWLCLKIEARLGLAPGLITFIMGLFLTQYASMIFILTLGLRVMWISMKELRPVQQ